MQIAATDAEGNPISGPEALANITATRDPLYQWAHSPSSIVHGRKSRALQTE